MAETDEIDALTSRARQLEEENALLRSMQSPGGDHAALKAENVMLRNELSGVRGAARPDGHGPVDEPMPRTLEEFNALPPHRREAVARQMTRQQRDQVLGRSAQDEGRESYL